MKIIYKCRTCQDLNDDIYGKGFLIESPMSFSEAYEHARKTRKNDFTHNIETLIVEDNVDTPSATD